MKRHLTILCLLAILLMPSLGPTGHAMTRSAAVEEATGDEESPPAPSMPTLNVAMEEPPDLIPTAPESLGDVEAGSSANFGYDPTSAYDQKGASAPRGFASGAPDELIDPFTGNLILRHTDFVLPGVAGLDLVLQRVYNSKIHRNYAAKASGDPNRINTGMLFVPTSPLGLGWNMHLGRIVGGVSAARNEALPGPRYYEAPDGSQQPFFTYSGPTCGGGDPNAVCLLTKQRGNPYRLDASGPWNLATADGRNITFAHTAFDGASIVHYATEIRDVNGNRIQIFYHDNTIPGIAVERDYFRHFVSSIVDSAGRTVQFGYQVVDGSDVVRLTSITALGRTFRYGYASNTPWSPLQAFLTSAQPPEGSPWRYGYDEINGSDCGDNSKRWCELTDITYPAGGTIAYTFDDLTFYSQTNPMSVRAVTRRTTGGRGISAAQWDYQYNRAANYGGSEHTVISRPDGSQEIFTFFGVGDGTYKPTGEPWKMGAILEKRIRQGGTILQSERYEWEASPPISDERTGDYWVGFVNGVHVPRMRQITVQRGDLTFVTTHTSFHEHNDAPLCTTEQGNGPPRYRLSTYGAVSVAQGTYQFLNIQLPRLSGLSYSPSSAQLCDPAQNGSWTPQIEDEMAFYEYDSEGRNISADQNGVVTETRYRADGSVDAEITYQGRNRQNGFCTVFDDYQYGVPKRIESGATAPACNGPIYTSTRTLNPDGSMASETNGRGDTTSFTYDGLGRITRIAPPDVTPIDVTYDGNASGFDSLRRVSQGPFWSENRFDGFYRQVVQTDATGVEVIQRYDALNRLTFRSQPGASGGTPTGSTFAYDGLGRTTSVTFHDQTSESFAYDSAAYIIRKTDRAGRERVETRMAFNDPDKFWLTRLQLPGHPEPTADHYTYLVGGHLASVNYGGRLRTIEYNFAKKVSRINQPESGNTYFGYDAAGNLRCRHWTSLCNDFRYDAPGTDVRYTVDGAGRTTKISVANGGTTDFVLDGAGNIESMTDAVGSHQFTYDAMGRIHSQSSTIEGVTYTLGYQYDGRGNLTQITYPSGRIVDYVRDAGNRVTEVTGYVSSIEYHPNELIKRMVYANGVVTTLTLDEELRPDQIRANGVIDLNFDFNIRGNVERILDGIDGNNTTSYTYDTLDRITDASGGWGQVHYDYNAAGDRIGETLNGLGQENRQTTYTYDGDGLLTGLSGGVEMSYQYDNRGNVFRRGEFSYQYDGENRISRISTLQGSRDIVYDGLGRKAMVRRIGCQNSRLFFYDPDGKLIAEHTFEGALHKEYVVLEGETIASYEYDPGSVSTAEIDFGDVEVMTTVTRTVTITNSANLSITMPGLTPDYPFELAVADPVVIPPNSTYEVPFVFRPFQRGTRTDTLESCASSGLRFELTMRGRGIAAQAQLTPPRVDMGDVPYGTTITRTFSMSNTGDAPLRVSEWSSGSDALQVMPAGPMVVDPGAAAELSFVFESAEGCGGPFEGSLYLLSNSLNRGQMDVSANVLALTVDTRDLNFAPVNVGESRSLNITLRNRAVVPLTPELSFNGGPQFSVNNLPTAQMQPGDLVEIPVTYVAGQQIWSPFGDHAMLQVGFGECPLVCEASTHLVGNSDLETVPSGGGSPAMASLNGSIHVASVGSDALGYAIRDPAAGWQSESGPAGDTNRAGLPALEIGPNGRLTALWNDPASLFTIQGGQLDASGEWGDVCSIEGFRRGNQSLATDDQGNAWMTYLDRNTFALNVSPIFDDAGVCQAGQPVRFSQAGVGWDSLRLASGAAGRLGMTLTQFEGLRFFDLDAGAATAVVETPVRAELNFGSTAAPAVDQEGGWHLLYAPIQTGVEYQAPATYLYRAPDGAWSPPHTLTPGSEGAMGLQIAVDSLGGLHATWSDQACAAPDLRQIYYATRPAFSNVWQISDVSTPGYVGFEADPALTLEDDRLSAVWRGDSETAKTLLFGQSEVGVRLGGSGTLSGTVSADQGGGISADDGHFQVEFPAGAVTAETELLYQRQAQPSQTTGSLRFGGQAFSLTASSNGQPVTRFDAPFRLTLRYSDDEWRAAGIQREEDLNLYFWDGAQWVGVLPCAGCTHDTTANEISVLLDHLTEFALLGPVSSGVDLYLPAVAR